MLVGSCISVHKFVIKAKDVLLNKLRKCIYFTLNQGKLSKYKLFGILMQINTVSDCDS